MGTLVIVLTYAAYLFIIVMYSIKAAAWLKMPRHIRWDLYPVIHEENYHYGGSYYEKEEWWKVPRHRSGWRSLLYALKDNFYMGKYFEKNRWYWAFLLPWHLGFIFIISFHILCFFVALAMHLGLDVSGASPQLSGQLLYYLLLVTGALAFILGAIGSIGMPVIRFLDPGLRAYATPFNYFNYLFFLLISLTGLYDLLVVDPTLKDYRTYWLGLITLVPPVLHTSTLLHIILFDLFLIYLPFTRSLHYITRIFAYYFIRWDDEPNLPGSKLEKEVADLLGRRVSWEAAHIPAGKTWAEAACESGLPEARKEKQ